MEPITVKYKVLDTRAKVPSYATPGSAAADLCAVLDAPLTLAPMERALVPTGLAIELPGPHSVALVYARSGLSIKHGLCMANGVGVVDSDYRGELKVPMVNLGREAYTIQPGERVAQLCIAPVYTAAFVPAEELGDTQRGEGVFGSTGKLDGIMNLILASGSPRRRELLSLYTTNFTVCVSDFDESAVQAATPAHLVEQLARGKCLAVSAQHPGAVVIGCDTVVDVNGEVFGKPHSEEDAKRMLRALSGATHEVHTGVCISDGARTESFVDSCRVTFFPLGEEEIDFYASTAEPYDKAGAYAIQGRAALWLDRIEGDYYTIMGLPVSRTVQLLAHFV